MTANPSTVCPESTIESANRRQFIKKAALATAAVGVGSLIIDKSQALPESTADSSKSTLAVDTAIKSATKTTSVTTDTPCCNYPGDLAVFDGKSDITGALGNSKYARLVGNVCGNCACALLCVTNLSSCCASNPTFFPTTGVSGRADCGTGVYGRSFNGIGVAASTSRGPAVSSMSSCGPGILAMSCSPIVGKFKNINIIGRGDKTALAQFETGDNPPIGWTMGVSGLHNPCSISDGVFYVKKGGNSAPSIVADALGKVGIATKAPNTTLQVKGGFSVGTRIEAGNYTMTDSDFAVLASAGSVPIKITLPSASNTGQLVHVKKIDPAKHTVTIERAGTDTIEGATSKSLSVQYSSLTLIAGGNGVWYVLSSAT